MSDITAPFREPDEDAIAFTFGHGETLVSYWHEDGHLLVRLMKAVVPQTTGTDVTGQAIAAEGPPVWLLFEDTAAVRLLCDYMVAIAEKGDASK